MTQYELPNISVDVVPMRVNPVTNFLEVLLGKRIYEPYIGKYALPGVLLTPHERLDEAVHRALRTKVSVEAGDVLHLVDLRPFDNPDRDPRGATVSIAKLALVSSDVEGEFVPVRNIINNDYPLPFDHATIVTAAYELFLEKFLTSRDFTQKVLGDVFSTKTVRSLMEQAQGNAGDLINYDPSNLTRRLKATGWLTMTDAEVMNAPRTPGRPARNWTWV